MQRHRRSGGDVQNLTGEVAVEDVAVHRRAAPILHREVHEPSAEVIHLRLERLLPDVDGIRVFAVGSIRQPDGVVDALMLSPAVIHGFGGEAGERGRALRVGGDGARRDGVVLRAVDARPIGHGVRGLWSQPRDGAVEYRLVRRLGQREARAVVGAGDHEPLGHQRLRRGRHARRVGKRQRPPREVEAVVARLLRHRRVNQCRLRVLQRVLARAEAVRRFAALAVVHLQLALERRVWAVRCRRARHRQFARQTVAVRQLAHDIEPVARRVAVVALYAHWSRELQRARLLVRLVVRRNFHRRARRGVAAPRLRGLRATPRPCRGGVGGGVYPRSHRHVNLRHRLRQRFLFRHAVLAR